MSSIPACTPVATTDITAARYLSPDLVPRTLPLLCEKGNPPQDGDSRRDYGSRRITVEQSDTPIGFKSTQKGYARGVRKAAWLTLTSHDRNLQHQIAVPIVWFRGRTLRSSSKHELVLPVIVSISSLSMGQ